MNDIDYYQHKFSIIIVCKLLCLITIDGWESNIQDRVCEFAYGWYIVNIGGQIGVKTLTYFYCKLQK